MSEPAPLPAPLPRVVVGERVRLELWRAEAIEEVRALVERSRESLAAFLPWAGEPVSAESEAAFQADAEAKWREGRMAGWALYEDGAIRGMLGLHRRGGPDELEIGYWLDDAATGRGLMTEACAMAVEVGFSVEGIDVIEILHDRANLRSGAVPQRLGFARTAAFTATPAARLESGIKVRWCLRRAAWLAQGRPRTVLETS